VIHRALESVAAPPHRGFTLLELMLALGLSALLVLGLVQVVAAAGASARLQDNHARLQENARLAHSVLSRAARETGFSPQPWNGAYPPVALGESTRDAVTARSDRLSVRSWSDVNCFNNRNAVRTADGEPAFYIREWTFELNGQANLAQQCRYGPSLTEMETQIRREGFVPGVEAFQLLYGEDTDGDGSVNRWVPGGRWSDETRLHGIRVGLLFSSEDSVLEPKAREFRVLDSTIRAPADGRMRYLAQYAVTFRGRNG
jgi:type IV pilus assembly protein PilW